MRATLDAVVVVVADVREIPSGVPKRLQELGVPVVRRRLEVGDYVVGPSAVVERKTALDLQDSVLKGRFWRRIGSLRRHVNWPYLVLEGRCVDAGRLTRESVRGIVLAVTELGVMVLWSEDASDTALWLRRLAVRQQEPRERDKPPYAQRFTRARQSPAEAALAAAPGISTKTARQLLEQFGSLRGVLAADATEWQSVPGVGPKRATSLRSMVNDEWPSVHPTSHLDPDRDGYPAT